MNSTLLGRWGEALVAEQFKKDGYKIIAVNYKTRFGEIDIIAENRKFIVFVEVKLRKNDKFGSASEFVTPSKQKKLRMTAEIWLSSNETKKDARFDVAEVTVLKKADGTESYNLNYITNAF